MIKRESLVRKYNPIIKGMDCHSPLTVGNGSFAVTVDITGLQTFYDEYKDSMPLLTMSDWGFHSFKNEKGGYYTLDDLEMTEYKSNGKTVKYPVRKTERNGAVYEWLRANPHRFNLCRLSIFLDGKRINPEELEDSEQVLDMYTGIITSKYRLAGNAVKVTTCVASSDTIGVKIESGLCRKRLVVLLDFPYASETITGSDFEAEEKHTTKLIEDSGREYIYRKLDDTEYYCHVNGGVYLKQTGKHEVTISNSNSDRNISFALSLGRKKENMSSIAFKQAVEESSFRYYSFWNLGAIVDVTDSEDERKEELQRRIITSMYLLATQDMGCLPPQETGLSCNSWYGKFHLEMHPIHQAWLALYGRGYYLEKSLAFYCHNLDKAKENAERNGYKGARWPKMTSPEAYDSPSVIAPLLVWQQPHVIYMCDLLYRSRYSDKRVEVPKETESEFLEKYKEVILETAEFMKDFLIYDANKDIYEMPAPLYSVQEKGDPEAIKNPPFECLYFSFGLKKAKEWLEKLGIEKEEYGIIAEKLAKPYIKNGLYQAYEGCDDTYERLNLDHPAHLFIYGWIMADYNKKILSDSLEKYDSTWDLKSLWGWDFALLAMTYSRLERFEDAFDALLKDTEKNTYVANGHNAQVSNPNLPLYLPGNGSLLLAMSVLKSCKGWYVVKEGLMDYPY